MTPVKMIAVECIVEVRLLVRGAVVGVLVVTIARPGSPQESEEDSRSRLGAERGLGENPSDAASDQQ
ncbi:MAG: hypothetical protein KF847_20385 [Pirellulales bacterium]|nr:hypothetical protein [Pirellulales bacterium]